MDKFNFKNPELEKVIQDILNKKAGYIYTTNILAIENISCVKEKLSTVST
jgi:hypothetical protein